MNPATEEFTSTAASASDASSTTGISSTSSQPTPQPAAGGLEERSRAALTKGAGAGVVKRWLGILVVLGCLGGAAVYAWPKVKGSLNEPERAVGWLTEEVKRDRLLVTVTEDGNVESAANIDVKCEVAGGSMILKIVEDGKQVKKDEKIIELDQSTIDEQLNAQKIVYEKALATKIQAEQDFEAAEIAVNEYKEGTYKQELQTLEANVTIALENQRAAQNVLDHTRRMFRKGFVTSLQLEADEFAVKRADLELQTAETARDVLVKFTKRKMIKELEAARDAAAARMRSEQAAAELERIRKERLEKMREKCIILAPQDGMVVYANSRSRRSSEVTIEEGAQVRENQTIIRLPDLSRMQVRLNVHESKVELVKPGLPARIVVQDREYLGEVVSIANQPENKSWFSADVKEYSAIVAMKGEIAKVKPGMTAKVTLYIADIDDQLTVPVECVVEQRGKFYVWVDNNGKAERRPVLLGATNDKVVAIRDGLSEGDKVLRNPRAVIEEAREELPGGEASEGETPQGIPKSVGGGATGSGEKTKKSTAKPTGSSSGSSLPATITSMDKDKDGKLSTSEVPSYMTNFFSKVDTNGDGGIDQTEWSAMRKKAAERKAKMNSGAPAGGGA